MDGSGAYSGGKIRRTGRFMGKAERHGDLTVLKVTQQKIKCKDRNYIELEGSFLPSLISSDRNRELMQEFPVQDLIFISQLRAA